MSEYQFVAFRACDKPVSGANLAYMQKQSSRAEITPWSFENEYNYSDFRGNALEMLRRGYDIHLHYASFGIRKLMIRLPHGFPNPSAAQPYLLDDTVIFTKDKQGSGGTLSVAPFDESGRLEDIGDIEGIIDRLVPLRAEILDGDLRPLYLMHLAGASDDNHSLEEREAPVPAGLNRLTDAQQALAELYGIDEALIAAAAKGSPPLPLREKQSAAEAEWIQRQPAARKDGWLVQLLTAAGSEVRADILEAYRADHPPPAWPTARLERTIAQLQEAAEKIADEAKRKAAEKAERKRAAHVAALRAAGPDKTLKETEDLVELGGTASYRKIAELLAELREVFAGTQWADAADKQAAKLTQANPTLSHLTSALRKQGFLPKPKPPKRK